MYVPYHITIYQQYLAMSSKIFITKAVVLHTYISTQLIEYNEEFSTLKIFFGALHGYTYIVIMIIVIVMYSTAHAIIYIRMRFIFEYSGKTHEIPSNTQALHV